MLPGVIGGKAMRWRRDRISAVLYDVGVKHERVAAALGRLLWGSDVRRLYSEQHLLASLPEGSLVIDIPCGGGVAFRGLEPGRRLAYVAVDLSRALIVRAWREAARRGLGTVRFVEANVDALPFPDSRFDLCLAYNGLHCFASPDQAVSEITRVLRPGGMLRGSTGAQPAHGLDDGAAAEEPGASGNSKLLLADVEGDHAALVHVRDDLQQMAFAIRAAQDVSNAAFVALGSKRMGKQRLQEQGGACA